MLSKADEKLSYFLYSPVRLQTNIENKVGVIDTITCLGIL